MGEEFYAIIKLVSGEEIFSTVAVDDSDCDNPIIILQNPVIMKLINSPNGNLVKIKPWMELSEDDIFMIRLDKIITLTESTDNKLIGLYEHYNSDTSINDNHFKSDGSVKPNKNMGYISTVEDARTNLENLFKLNQEKP